MVLVGEVAVRDCVDRVVAVLRAAGRSEETVRHHRVVLERFATFLAGRGLDAASEGVCLDFIAIQTGVRLGSLQERVSDRDVQAVRRPVVLLADALAGRVVDSDRSVIPPKEACPARFRPLRDDYLTWCRQRGNAPATVLAKDKFRPADSWATWRRWDSRTWQRWECGIWPASCCVSATYDASRLRRCDRVWRTS